MTENLERLTINPKTGNERFHENGKRLDFDLTSFWRWSTSNLVSNATRGVLAEYIVAKAVNANLEVRNEWDAFDLETHDGIKIEVKSAAYIQSWHQDKLSSISFRVQKKLKWDANTNLREGEATRPADVYVFALLAHKDKKTIDPMNLKQWHFFVLSTETLNQRKRSQHSITLNSLENISGGMINFNELRQAVKAAYQKNLDMRERSYKK